MNSQRYSWKSDWKTSNDGFHDLSRNICNNRSTYPRYFLMENKNSSIDLQKISAEKLNGRFALFGVIALAGAYLSTEQIIPGIV